MGLAGWSWNSIDGYITSHSLTSYAIPQRSEMSAVHVYEIMSIISGISLKALKMLGHIERLIICYIPGGLGGGGRSELCLSIKQSVSKMYSL